MDVHHDVRDHKRKPPTNGWHEYPALLGGKDERHVPALKFGRLLHLHFIAHQGEDSIN